jgi:hypothetical protein
LPIAGVNDLNEGFNMMNDTLAALEEVEEESVFVDEISDDVLEAAASGPTVTFTLSVVLFACRFC